MNAHRLWVVKLIQVVLHKSGYQLTETEAKQQGQMRRMWVMSKSRKIRNIMKFACLSPRRRQLSEISGSVSLFGFIQRSAKPLLVLEINMLSTFGVYAW